MLKIYLRNMEKAIYHPPTYFDNQYEDEWITKELSIRMIKEVDKSDVINSSLIQSPVLTASSRSPKRRVGRSNRFRDAKSAENSGFWHFFNVLFRESILLI